MTIFPAAIGAVIGLIIGEICIPLGVKMLKKKLKKTKKSKRGRKISQIERDKGRSEDYWQMSPRDQWDEDKRLGILDWDGK